MVVDIINGLIEAFALLGDMLVFLLPTWSLVSLLGGIDTQLLRAINYYIPINTMLGIANSWVLAVAMWYLYMILLRWVKAIQ